ncbi:alpha/beta family hydrolase [Branchiibius cervicis]|uniref:Alpha/beta family hydrolase n=1 Tax=Branchiibius cervicis TaxID=908252 RepID=A0ABW2ARQ7_9MICO
MSLTRIETPVGPARAHIRRAADPRGTVVLSHGAGGGIDAPDLVALTALVGDGWNYVLVEQPWRVAGKKIAPAPKTLDAAWIPIIAALYDGRRRLTGPWITGGRSAGARVACRTAAAVGADGVLALAFPLHPPGHPEKSRADEGRQVGVPLLVVQGQRDPFGTPQEVSAAVPTATVRPARGDHGFTKDPQDVVAAVRDWLECAPGGLGR